jgi:hypothetical protein
MDAPPKKKTHRVALGEEERILYLSMLEEMKALRREVEKFNEHASELVNTVQVARNQRKLITFPN